MTRGPLSKPGYLQSATRPLAVSQSVAEYERRHSASRAQNVSRSYSDSEMAPVKGINSRSMSMNDRSEFPPALQSPSSQGSSTSSLIDDNGREAFDRRERRPSFSRSLDDSVPRRPPASTALLKPISRSTRTSQPDPNQDSSWTGYVLSPDMEQKVNERIVVEISRKYAGPLRTQRAARCIQHAFREYRLKKRMQHLREARQSRLITVNSTGEMMEAISRGNHLPLSKAESLHRPLQRVTDQRPIEQQRAQTISPALSLVSNMSESTESIVGITEMVIPPELMRMQTEASMTSDLSSDTSSVSASPVPEEALRRMRGSESGRATPNSMTSSPGMSLSGTPFEVVRRASFSVKMADSKLRRQRHLRIGITHFNR